MMKRLSFAVLVAVFGAAQMVVTYAARVDPTTKIPVSKLPHWALDALCQYLGWFCS